MLTLWPLLVQESTLSDDSTPPSSSPKILSSGASESKCSYPYHTLSQSSDEVRLRDRAGLPCWSQGPDLTHPGGCRTQLVKATAGVPHT